MNKFIPICVVVILGLVAVTSGFKCYVCESITEPDCVDNSEQTKFETPCPEIPISQTTDKTTSYQKSADFIVSLVKPRSGKPLTSPKAVFHHCGKFTGTANGNDVVIRTCIPTLEALGNQCEDGTSGQLTGEACVCDKELCNGATSLKTLTILPIIGVVAYSLF
jgi:hypothetical protein